MNDKACASRSWTWPVKLDEYDRTPELKPEEAETLCANQSILVEGIPPKEECLLPRSTDWHTEFPLPLASILESGRIRRASRARSTNARHMLYRSCQHLTH